MVLKSKSSLMDITERAKKAKWIISPLPLIVWLKKEGTELLRTVRMEKKKNKNQFAEWWWTGYSCYSEEVCFSFNFLTVRADNYLGLDSPPSKITGIFFPSVSYKSMIYVIYI